MPDTPLDDWPEWRWPPASSRRGDSGRIDRVNFWAGQSAGLAQVEPAGEIVARMWAEADALLGPG